MAQTGGGRRLRPPGPGPVPTAGAREGQGVQRRGWVSFTNIISQSVLCFLRKAFSSWSSSEEALARCEGLIFNVPLDGGTKCRENATAADMLEMEGLMKEVRSLGF